jgi:hypothetical protein
LLAGQDNKFADFNKLAIVNSSCDVDSHRIGPNFLIFSNMVLLLF